MTSRVVGLALCALGMTLGASTRAHAQTRVERRVALDRDGMVKGFVPAGSVTIVGWDRDSLVVTGTVASGERFYFGGGRAGVKFGVEPQSPDGEARPAHLVVHLPRNSSLSMRGVSAAIQATDASGSFYSVGGDITIAGRVGEVDVEAMDGNVSIVAHGRWVRARTTSGELRLGGEIEDAAASTVTGRVFVSTTGLTSGQFGSVTGDIVFAAPLGSGGAFSFDDHSGAVELRLQPSATGSFSLTTISGSIENGVAGARPAAGSGGRGQTLAFRLGTGGPHVTVRTFKGAIRLRSR